MNSIQITEVNALHFLQAVEEGIEKGFYIDTSIECYPQLGFPLSVRMFLDRGVPELRYDLADNIELVKIAEYDPITFILNFQSAAQQGFRVQDHGTNIDPVGFKGAYMTRPAAKATVVLDLDLNVPEATTEALKATTKRKPTQTKKEI